MIPNKSAKPPRQKMARNIVQTSQKNCTETNGEKSLQYESI